MSFAHQFGRLNGCASMKWDLVVKLGRLGQIADSWAFSSMLALMRLNPNKPQIESLLMFSLVFEGMNETVRVFLRCLIHTRT